MLIDALYSTTRGLSADPHFGPFLVGEENVDNARSPESSMSDPTVGSFERPVRKYVKVLDPRGHI